MRRVLVNVYVVNMRSNKVEFIPTVAPDGEEAGKMIKRQRKLDSKEFEVVSLPIAKLTDSDDITQTNSGLVTKEEAQIEVVKKEVLRVKEEGK